MTPVSNFWHIIVIAAVFRPPVAGSATIGWNEHASTTWRRGEMNIIFWGAAWTSGLSSTFLSRDSGVSWRQETLIEERSPCEERVPGSDKKVRH